MHGYELKQNLMQLAGHFRPVSDGALYPAITRLERQGFIIKKQEAGKAAAPRQVLTLTDKGHEELVKRLAEPSEQDISDRNRFFTILAFLKYADPLQQKNVLERRLRFIQGGRSFFQKDGQPVTNIVDRDPFRLGMLHIAKETSKVERAWLLETIENLHSSD